MLPPEIQTERLILKQTSKADERHFFELLQNPQVVQFCFDMPTPDEIQQQFECRLAPWNTTSTHWLSLSIYEKTSSLFIGIVGFKIDHSHDDQAEIGFLLMPVHFGKGYATEAVAAMQQYATTLGIQTIIARVTGGNGASSRVLEKCGFILQRELANAVFINRIFYNDLEYLWSAVARMELSEIRGYE